MSPSDRIQQATAHHTAGRLAEAEALYRLALIENPADANALHLLGVARRGSGRATEGRPLILRAIAVSPGYGPFYYNLANLLLGLGETAAAGEWLARGLAADGGYPPLRELLCRVAQDLSVDAYNLGDLKAAWAWWERCFDAMIGAPALDPFYCDLCERLTRIALVLDRPDHAVLCTRLRSRVDFAGVPDDQMDVFAVGLHGFAEWSEAAGLRAETWIAPAEPLTGRVLADYPAYLRRHVEALRREAETPVGVTLPGEVEIIQGFYVKDNYESFVIAGRRAALYENRELYVKSPTVPLVGITPGAVRGVVRLSRPHHRVIEVDEPGIVLPSTPNYWHFLVDVLPKLMARGRTPELAGLPVYLYDLRGYHYEMLEMAGVPRDRVVDLKPADIPPRESVLFRFRRAAIPSAVPYPAAYRWLRETFLPQARPDRGPPPRRIFLSRRGAYPKHRIANDAAVGERLARHGFEVVQPETLSVLETVELAAQAEIVVAPIGAGTANHVFLPPYGTWIHLNNPDFFHPDSPWNSQMGTQVSYIGTFRHLTGRFTGDPATFPDRLVDRLEIPVEIDLDALEALVLEAEARLRG